MSARCFSVVGSWDKRILFNSQTKISMAGGANFARLKWNLRNRLDR